MARIATIKRRSEFLRIRGGIRYAGPWFALEAKPCVPATGAAGGALPVGARFGFTVTKKLGSAVVRNRIRRRLREAVAELAKTAPFPCYDYVIVARDKVLEPSYAELRGALLVAFARLHKVPANTPRTSGDRR